MIHRFTILFLCLVFFWFFMAATMNRNDADCFERIDSDGRFCVFIVLVTTKAEFVLYFRSVISLFMAFNQRNVLFVQLNVIRCLRMRERKHAKTRMIQQKMIRQFDFITKCDRSAGAQEIRLSNIWSELGVTAAAITIRLHWTQTTKKLV